MVRTVYLVSDARLSSTLFLLCNGCCHNSVTLSGDLGKAYTVAKVLTWGLISSKYFILFSVRSLLVYSRPDNSFFHYDSSRPYNSLPAQQCHQRLTPFLRGKQPTCAFYSYLSVIGSQSVYSELPLICTPEMSIQATSKCPKVCFLVQIYP